MTTAFWCVLTAALLPYLFVFYAKATPAFMKEGHNKNPRAYEARLTGPRQRAYLAHLNGFEAFPPFAAAVIIAHLVDAPQGTVDALALTFIAFRVLHAFFYIADLDRLRSIAWLIAVGCMVSLFVLAAG